MAIVAKYQFGQTTVYIDDSSLVKTEEEREQIMDQIRRIVISIIEEEGYPDEG